MNQYFFGFELLDYSPVAVYDLTTGCFLENHLLTV